MNKNTIRLITLILALMMLTSSFASCSESNSGAVYNDKAYSDEMAEAVNEPVGAGAEEDQKSVQGEQSQEKLVYTCEMNIETTDYTSSAEEIEKKIESYKGIIESKYERDTDENWYYSDSTKNSGTLHCTLTVKIPSADLNTFMDEISTIGKVTSKSMNVENISSQYHNVEARIEALEIQQTRLLEMLKEAETVDDMLTIESRLTDVETELNQYKTEKSAMDVKTAYSTVTIYLDEVVEYSKDGTVVKTSTFWDRLGNSFSDSWNIFLSILEGLLFFIIRAFPVILIFGGIGFGIFILIRTIVRKSKKKKTAQPNASFNPANGYPVQNNYNPNFTQTVTPQTTDKSEENKRT